MTRRLIAVALATVLGACTHHVATTVAPMASGATVASVAEITAGFDARVQHDIETLRSATNAFHDLSAAKAAGYPTDTPRCVDDSTMGGMGRHYLDRKKFDDTLEITHPEMIIYAPAGNGAWKLAGVEYAIPFRLRPSTATPPRLFGQEFRRHEEYKYWYLHVWAWEKNPAGLFADWSPLIKC
jgi:hypothetical protein